MHGVKEIIREAESLPAEERALVVDSLLRTLNPTDPEIDRKWTEVAKRRLKDLRSGRVVPIEGIQVFARIRKRFGSSDAFTPGPLLLERTINVRRRNAYDTAENFNLRGITIKTSREVYRD